VVLRSLTGGVERAIVRGHDHPALGTSSVTALAASLAIGISAGARAKTSPTAAPNEDAGAVARGSRADLLVVADGHFGTEASELVVDHVLRAIGEDPPPADLTDEDLVALFYAAGIAVQRETTRPGCPHPHSRSTLAIALVASDLVQWAAIGDSCVVVATGDGGTRLDAPRPAYLGHHFTAADVAGALSRGRTPRVSRTCVVLATDGLVQGLEEGGAEVAASVGTDARDAAAATDVAQALLGRALGNGVRDAVTVAVALA
jgi:serine/threonine protein phosphatase PrpC